MADLDVFIGFDFGTSFSKICYNIGGTLYVYKVNNEPFIPTEVYYSVSKKEIYFEKNNNNAFKAKYFKYSMAFDGLSIKKIKENLPQGYTYKDLSIVFSIFYISCIICKIKNESTEKIRKKSIGNFLAGIFNKQASQNNTRINWEINMAAPIDTYRGDLYTLYRSVLIAAYELSEVPDLTQGMDISQIKKIYSMVRNGNINNHKYDNLTIHPELFVEAVFFTNIPGIDTGSYILMDIGGGTVDIGILWKREWKNTIKFDLVVINIIKYGLEVLCQQINNGNTDENTVLTILKKWNEYPLNEKTRYISEKEESKISEYFLNNLNKMREIEALNIKIGINNINRKRIYYSGGGYNIEWYKDKIQKLKNNEITEDDYYSNKFPVNYSNKQNIHRLIIAMELAQPVDLIEKNMGTTTIILGGNVINNIFTKKIEVYETEIKREETVRTMHESLQDRQRELYGDDPI